MTIYSLLHGLSHYDLSLKKVSNHFQAPKNWGDVWGSNNSYQESIEVFWLVPSIAGLLYLILCTCIMFSFCCCRRDKRNQGYLPLQDGSINGSRPVVHLTTEFVHESPPRQIGRTGDASDNDNEDLRESLIEPSDQASQAKQGRELSPCARYSRGVMAALAIGCMAAAISYAYQMNNTMKQIEDDWTDSYQTAYRPCVRLGQNMSDVLLKGFQLSVTIYNTTTEPNKTMSRLIMKAYAEATQLSSEFLETANTVHWGDTSEVDTYRQVFYILQLAMVACVAAVLLLSCCTKSIAVTRWMCLNGGVSLCLGVALLCVWCLATIQFAYSVQVSDACSDSQDSVLQVVNNSLAYSSQHDQAVMTYQIANYYLYCDDAHSYNPLISDLTEAQTGMSLINSSVLWYYYNGSSYGVPQNESTQLLMDYQESMKQSADELVCLQCPSLNRLYDHTRNDLCLTFVKQWYITYVCEIALVFFVAIRGCFLCRNNVPIQSKPKTVLTEDDIKPNFGRPDLSPEPAQPSFEFTDADVKEALRYLYKCETPEERKEKANELKTKGYPNSHIPVSKNAVDKAVSILNNRDRTSTSTYIHPFLQEILDQE